MTSTVCVQQFSLFPVVYVSMKKICMENIGRFFHSRSDSRTFSGDIVTIFGFCRKHITI